MRGLALRGWAANVRRRFGAAGLADVREALGAASGLVADDPDDRQYLPVWLQLRLTDLIIDRCLAGRGEAFVEALREDALRRASTVAPLALRVLGPGLVLRSATAAHAALYDVGEAHAVVGAAEATVAWSGAACFANPTWRLLHAVATQLAAQAATGARVSLAAVDAGPEAFAVRLAW